MVVISYSGKEANGKIVYYGPGLGGKTTNLEFIYDSVPASSRGKMVSMKTQTDRTLFFDFLPLDLGELGGFKTRFLLYTVPGQVFYNATRKLVLRGADAVAFIADSQRGKMEENKESLANLEENLADYDLSLDSIPWVIQYNKRDLPDIYTVEELNKELNPRNVPHFEAIATEGVGVFETFRGLSRLLLEKLSEEIGQRMVIGRHFGQKRGQDGEQEQPTGVPEITTQPMQGTPSEVETLEVAASSAPGDEVGESWEGPAEPAGEEGLEDGTAPEAETPADWTERRAATGEDVVAHAESREGPAAEDIVSEQAEREEEVAEETAQQAAEEMTGQLEEPVVQAAAEAKEQSQPIIEREREEVRSFFSRGEKHPPLEQAIRRDEIQLSEQPDSEPESETWAPEPPVEAQQEPEPEETVEEMVLKEEEQGEASDEEEASFLGIIRRNDVGVFKRQESRDERPKPAATAAWEGEAEQGSEHVISEHVIEVPVDMAPDEEEKEIVLTLKLKLKRKSRQEQEQSDEFLLDGISR